MASQVRPGRSGNKNKTANGRARPRYWAARARGRIRALKVTMQYPLSTSNRLENRISPHNMASRPAVGRQVSPKIHGTTGSANRTAATAPRARGPARILSRRLRTRMRTTARSSWPNHVGTIRATTGAVIWLGSMARRWA